MPDDLQIALRIRARDETQPAVRSARRGIRSIADELTRLLRIATAGLGLRQVARGLTAVYDATVRQEQAMALVAQRIDSLGSQTALTTDSLARMASADRGVLEGRGRALGARGQRTFARMTNASKTPAAVRLRPRIIPPT